MDSRIVWNSNLPVLMGRSRSGDAQVGDGPCTVGGVVTLFACARPSDLAKPMAAAQIARRPREREAPVDAEDLMRTVRAENLALRDACRRSQEECQDTRERALLMQRRGAAAVDRAVAREVTRLRRGLP